MELRRLEAMVKEIHEEMLFLRTREEEMRDLNGGATGPSQSACPSLPHDRDLDALDEL